MKIVATPQPEKLNWQNNQSYKPSRWRRTLRFLKKVVKKLIFYRPKDLSVSEWLEKYGVSQAKDYWETTPTAAVASQWIANPIVEKVVNRRLSGGVSHKYWLAWLIQDYFADLKFDNLLSIGCGIGNHEVVIAKLGLAKNIDAFDFSEASLEVARKSAAEAGVTINFYQDDFNAFEISPDRKYDVVFCSGSLHHVKELERCLSIVNQCLKPNGYFIVNEYIGDCYNIYNQDQVEILNRLYKCFPEQMRSGLRDYFVNPTIKQVYATDPSEAVRSKLILPFLQQYFNMELFNQVGGGILHPLYPLLNHTELLPGDPKSETIVKLLLEFESILMEMPKGLPSDFCLCILRPKEL